MAIRSYCTTTADRQYWVDRWTLHTAEEVGKEHQLESRNRPRHLCNSAPTELPTILLRSHFLRMSDLTIFELRLLPSDSTGAVFTDFLERFYSWCSVCRRLRSFLRLLHRIGSALWEIKMHPPSTSYLVNGKPLRNWSQSTKKIFLHERPFRKSAC